MKNNKTGLVIGIIIIIVLGWYFFIKKSDYVIHFKAKTATGTVFQGIKEWAKNQQKADNEIYTTLESKNYGFIKQKMTKGNAEFEYIWEITSDNDSTSTVNVGIKEMHHSLYNRLTAPFIATPFKTKEIKKVTDFRNGLNDHLKTLKVKIDGEGSSPAVFVAYINLKSVMQEKAQTMIGNDAQVMTYLSTNKIKPIGRPYVEVVNWDLDNETLDFNYCFPIAANTKYVADKHIKFKTIPAYKGLKATYYGNYRTSDRGWFALLDYAERHNIKLKNLPLENFMANPFNGGNEIEWETKIIIPFQ